MRKPMSLNEILKFELDCHKASNETWKNLADDLHTYLIQIRNFSSACNKIKNNGLFIALQSLLEKKYIQALKKEGASEKQSQQKLTKLETLYNSKNNKETLEQATNKIQSLLNQASANQELSKTALKGHLASCAPSVITATAFFSVLSCSVISPLTASLLLNSPATAARISQIVSTIFKHCLDVPTTSGLMIGLLSALIVVSTSVLISTIIATVIKQRVSKQLLKILDAPPTKCNNSSSNPATHNSLLPSNPAHKITGTPPPAYTPPMLEANKLMCDSVTRETLWY